MEVKIFEVRDRATFLPVMAVKLQPRIEQERYLFARSGYGRTEADQYEYVLVSRLAGGKGWQTCDPYDGGSDTMLVAHKHIIDKWADLSSGQVIDVEFIRGETAAPKLSESVTATGDF